MEAMRKIPDKFFQLAITDPPYGIGIDGQKISINKNPKHNRKEHKKKGGIKTYRRKSISESLKEYQPIRSYGAATILLSI